MKYLFLLCIIVMGCHDTREPDKKIREAKIEKRVRDSLDNVQINKHINRIKSIKESLQIMGITGDEADKRTDTIIRLTLFDTTASWYIKYKDSVIR